MVDEIPATLGDTEGQTTPKLPDSSQMQYPSVYEFYDGVVKHLLRDRLIGPRHQRWSASWWNSPEAQMRMDAIWRSYESLKDDPATGLSVWFKDHFDPHMNVLTSDAGPFGESRDTSKRGEDPAYEPPPQEVLEAKKRLAF